MALTIDASPNASGVVAGEIIKGSVLSICPDDWLLVTFAPVFVPGLNTIELCSHSVQMLAYIK